MRQTIGKSQLFCTSECRGGGKGETEGEEKIVSTVNEKGQKPTITASSRIGHCLDSGQLSLDVLHSVSCAGFACSRVPEGRHGQK